LSALAALACGPGTPSRTPSGEEAVTAPAASAASSGSTPQPAAAEAREPVLERVALGTSLGLSTSVYIAIERGYFTAEGIGTEIENFRTPSETAPALATGQLDVALQGVTPTLFNMNARDTGARIVANNAYAHPSREFNQTLLVVRKPLWDSGEVRGPGDLRGRRVGVQSLGGPHEVVLERMLRAAGLTKDDVDLVGGLSFPDILAALANGAIDAAIEAEPFVTAGAAQQILVELMGAGEAYPHQEIAVNVYSRRFAQERTDVARRWMIANLRGARDLNDAMLTGRDRDEVVRIIARNSGLDPERLPVRAALRTTNPDGYVNRETILADMEWFATRGLVPQPPTAAALFDDSFVDHALTVLGPYSPR
jgi:NitT/TauT family transport system substrate-binding protein